MTEENVLGLEVGRIYVLGDIWDGEGEIPTESYSYTLGAEQWINYEFKFLYDSVKTEIESGTIGRNDVLDIPVILTNIEIL